MRFPKKFWRSVGMLGTESQLCVNFAMLQQAQHQNFSIIHLNIDIYTMHEMKSFIDDSQMDNF